MIQTVVPFAEICRALLPRPSSQGYIVVLTVYFDDSGTHDDSEIMVMAGFIGTERQWSAFDGAWNTKLASPLPGKSALRRFHMSECEAAQREFAGYNRAEKDALIHDLRQIIIESELRGWAIAIDRKAWDRLVLDPARIFFGDAEQHCFRYCMSFAIDYARKNQTEKFISVVFDNRPHRTALHRMISDAFQRFYYDDPHFPDYPKLVGVSFLSSELVRPLQAADILAWETYQVALEHLRTGEPVKLRAHLERLVATGLMTAAFLDEPAIDGMTRAFEFRAT